MLPWYVWVALFAVSGVCALLFFSPRAQLQLARWTGVTNFEVRRIYEAGDLLVIVEEIGLQRGSLGRISTLSPSGTLRSRLFDDYRPVHGIIGDLAWTRPRSLRLPSLEDGPAEAEVIAECGLRPISVGVGDGVLSVRTEDGEVHECRPPAGQLERPVEPAEPATPPPFLLTQGSRLTGLTLEGATIGERLFDARLFRPRGVEGDAVVVFGRSLAADTTLVVARFGVEGERWRTDLTTPEVRFVRTIGRRVVADDSQVTSLGELIIVLANDASGSVGAIALGRDDGRVRWARLIE